MSLIKPSFVENLYTTFFALEPDRPMYYMYVVRVGRSIFLSLGFHDKAQELDGMIREKIEIPLKSDFGSIIQAYYNPRFMFSKKAFTKIGDSVDYKYVTRYEIGQMLEELKDWVYDEITEMSSLIRFTRSSQVMT
jgi:hypothetical protein